MADPTYRSSSTVADATTSTFSVTKPTGTTDGDLLTAFQCTQLSGGTTPATPTGWTLKDTQSFGTGFSVLQRFEKLAASEGASWTFNNAGGGALSPVASVYVIASTPGAAASEGSSKTSGTSTTPDPGTYTTAVNNELILVAWGDGSAPALTITPDGTFTALGLIGSSSKLNAGYKTAATAGVVSNRSATFSSSADWGAILAAIPPSASPLTIYPPFPGLPVPILAM